MAFREDHEVGAGGGSNNTSLSVSGTGDVEVVDAGGTQSYPLSDQISADGGNVLEVGTDGKLYSDGSGDPGDIVVGITGDFVLLDHYVSLEGGIFPISHYANGNAPVPTALDAEAGHPGIRHVETGDQNAQSRVTQCFGTQNTIAYFEDNNPETHFYMVLRLSPADLTAGEEYRFWTGFLDTENIDTSTKKINFLYDGITYGDNTWRVQVTGGGQTVTKTIVHDLGNTSEWHYFKISVWDDAGDMRCDFYYGSDTITFGIVETILESELTALTGTFPQQMGIHCGSYKQQAANIARFIDIDAFSFYKKTT